MFCPLLLPIIQIIQTSFMQLSSINVLTANKTNGFNDIKIIHSRRQPRNPKRILTKAEFSNIVSTVSKFGDTRCLCCSYLLLQNSYKFKNVNKIFTLKSPMNCNSSNLILCHHLPNV